MKHQIPDWVAALIDVLPFLAIVAIWVFIYISVKRKGPERVLKEMTPKKMVRDLILWAAAGLILVVVFNMMSGARH